MAEKSATSKELKLRVRVWDGFVRASHWAFVLFVLVLVISAHMGQQELHLPLGTALAMIVVTRLAWGIVGPEHARFASFVAAPRVALNYLRDIARGHPRRYLGHNPAGGWMVLTLLATLSTLLGSGFALEATLEFDGPLVGLLAGVDDEAVHRFMLVHKIAMNMLYLLVPLHLLGVVLASRQHRENLVGAMITGYKPLITER